MGGRSRSAITSGAPRCRNSCEFRCLRKGLCNGQDGCSKCPGLSAGFQPINPIFLSTSLFVLFQRISKRRFSYFPTVVLLMSFLSFRIVAAGCWIIRRIPLYFTGRIRLSGLFPVKMVLHFLFYCVFLVTYMTAASFPAADPTFAHDESWTDPESRCLLALPATCLLPSYYGPEKQDDHTGAPQDLSLSDDSGRC